MSRLTPRFIKPYQTRQFEQAVSQSKIELPVSQQAVAASTTSLALENTENFTPPGEKGGVIGRLEIGRLGLAVMILEGTDNRVLRRGVGHIPESALPGERGNVGIAGHRDTFFRDLRKIEKSDEITLTTLNGSFRYLVDFSEVVDPDDTQVLDDSGNASLTLVTCYPFFYVGPAPKRMVVRAHLLSQ